jgi:hypothetical protein
MTMQPFPFNGHESGQVDWGDVETGIGPVLEFELLSVRWNSGGASFQPRILVGLLFMPTPKPFV